jgi:hypothetical protein
MSRSASVEAVVTRAGEEDARSRGTFELTRTRLGARIFIRLARHQRVIVMFVPTSVVADALRRELGRVVALA